MMPLTGIVPHRLFKGQVLSAVEQKKIADGRILIGTMQNRALCDPQAAPESDRIRRVPPGGEQCPDKIGLAPDE
jgi:hypothetical protein